MKNFTILRLFGITTMVAIFGFTTLGFGDESTEMLNKALDLVHQAWNPGGDPPSNDQRTDLLNQALKLAQDAPQHNVRGHRVKAIKDIQAALAEIKMGDPSGKAYEQIHDADSELRSALSIAE
jgi:hypothetical protein